MVRLSQRLLVVFASAVLFVSACTAENVEGKNDLASEQAQDSALEVDELGLFSRRLASSGDGGGALFLL